MIRQRLVKGIAQVPAMGQMGRGGFDDLAFGADAFDEHDELQLEEDDRVDRRPAVSTMMAKLDDILDGQSRHGSHRRMDDDRPMQRIAIVGPAGSGKSTVARQLGEVLDLPVIHLDALFWQPGWHKPSREEWHERVSRLVHGERWILDGTYSETLDLRLAATDAVVFLDVPRWTCLRRVILRTLRSYGRTRLYGARGAPIA